MVQEYVVVILAKLTGLVANSIIVKLTLYEAKVRIVSHE